MRISRINAILRMNLGHCSIQFEMNKRAVRDLRWFVVFHDLPCHLQVYIILTSSLKVVSDLGQNVHDRQTSDAHHRVIPRYWGRHNNNSHTMFKRQYSLNNRLTAACMQWHWFALICPSCECDLQSSMTVLRCSLVPVNWFAVFHQWFSVTVVLKIV